MPAQPDQIPRALSSRSARKELLILACEVDRHAWRRAGLAPGGHPGRPMPGDLLRLFEPLCQLLPGRLGRWLRGIRIFTQLGRTLGRLLR